MPDHDCPHCGRTLKSRKGKDQHIEAKHADEVWLTPSQWNTARKWAAGLVLVALLAWGVTSVEPRPTGSVTDGPVHWHADLQVFVCGERQDLSHLGSQNSHHGTPLLHTHGDNQIHVEGEVRSWDTLTLGNYFDTIGVELSNTSLMDKTEGDTCQGEPGSISVSVNGENVSDYQDYRIQDGDSITVRFS